MTGSPRTGLSHTGLHTGLPHTGLLCVALSPAVDVTYVLDELTPGRIHRPQQVLRVAGGKGFNVARAARRLGADVTAAGVVGGHAGRWLADALRADGVAAELVPGHAETRTCVSVLDAAIGTLTEVYEQAAPVAADEWDALVEVVASRATDGWVTLSGSLPAGAPADSTGRLARAARAGGARIALDTHGPALAAALPDVDLVKVNVAEAAELLGRPADDPRTLAVELLARAASASLVVVTAGPAGAVAALRDTSAGRLVLDGGRPHVIHATVPPIDAAFPVGSGDSFLAGLVTGLISGDVEHALRLAVATGSANATVPGPGVFDPETVARLSEQVVLSP